MPRRRKSVSCPCHCSIAQPRTLGEDVRQRFLSHCLVKRRRPGDIRGVRREAVYGSNAPSNKAFQKNRTEKDIFRGRGAPLGVTCFLCDAAPGSSLLVEPGLYGSIIVLAAQLRIDRPLGTSRPASTRPSASGSSRSAAPKDDPCRPIGFCRASRAKTSRCSNLILKPWTCR